MPHIKIGPLIRKLIFLPLLRGVPAFRGLYKGLGGSKKMYPTFVSSLGPKKVINA